MKTALEFAILCSNRRLKIELTARQKGIFLLCRYGDDIVGVFSSQVQLLHAPACSLPSGRPVVSVPFPEWTPSSLPFQQTTRRPLASWSARSRPDARTRSAAPSTRTGNSIGSPATRCASVSPWNAPVAPGAASPARRKRKKARSVRGFYQKKKGIVQKYSLFHYWILEEWSSHCIRNAKAMGSFSRWSCNSLWIYTPCNSVKVEIKFHLECKLHFPSAQPMHLTKLSESIEAKYWVSWLSFDD